MERKVIMFKEYFAEDTWVQVMPGIYSCIFHEKKSERVSKPIPVKLATGVSEIFFCIHGKITFRRDTGQVEQLTDQGILLLSDCGHLEEVKVQKPLEGICLCICRAAAGESLSRLCEAYGDIQITMKQVGKMMQEWNGVCLIPRQGWSQSMFCSLDHLAVENQAQYCIMKCFELVYLLYTGDAQTGVHPGAWKIERQRKLVEDIQAFLLENLSERLTIYDVCQHFHISPTSCKTCFRTYCGIPIHQWISQRRMEKAAILLEESELPVIEIAQSLGYSGCSQFNASFKKKYGETPSQYRKYVRYH